jgi:4-hydroxy-tetrahydrodipicolinate synthase
MKPIAREKLTGMWSAAPTPLTTRMEIDTESVRRMVEHHAWLGVKGLFLLGTNGEGPWLTDRQKRQLVRSVIRANRRRMLIAVQVTDNSAARILENIEAAREDGADIAVIAPPYFMIYPTPERIYSHYCEAIRASVLPVGIYDRGRYSPVFVPDDALKRIYDEKNVILIKDSSMDAKRMQIALSARKKRPALCLLNGNEFNCVSYLEAGYDGLLLGGGVFNAFIAQQIMDAVQEKNFAKAERLQKQMNRIMYAVYGGKKLTCWIAGEKQLLVEMGIFRTDVNLIGYRVNASCLRAIRKLMKEKQEILTPYQECSSQARYCES